MFHFSLFFSMLRWSQGSQEVGRWLHRGPRLGVPRRLSHYGSRGDGSRGAHRIEGGLFRFEWMSAQHVGKNTSSISLFTPLNIFLFDVVLFLLRSLKFLKPPAQGKTKKLQHLQFHCLWVPQWIGPFVRENKMWSASASIHSVRL